MIQSYSSMATFKQCPAKYKFAYIDRVEVQDLPPGPALTRGTAVHESVDDYILGKSEFLHPDIHAGYGQFMMGLRENNTDLRPEYKWGITWEFEKCDYKDPRAMLHGYIDLLIVPDDPEANLPLYEWKTGGKYIKDHLNQVHMYSVAMLAHFPERKEVDAIITWFDHKDFKQVTYPQSMMFEYRPALRAEVGTIADATRFPPMPSFKCQWCKFSRHNGGPCPVA